MKGAAASSCSRFACYGYGTPAEGDFAHWLGEPELNAEQDFVAALPVRLLAHPHGPVAYIGHVDTAFLHGFNDPDAPFLLERWHPRIDPFRRALESLLQTQPVGRALAAMGERYDVLNAVLTSVADRHRRADPPTPGYEDRLASALSPARTRRTTTSSVTQRYGCACRRPTEPDVQSFARSGHPPERPLTA
jgi:hypothetical protein